MTVTCIKCKKEFDPDVDGGVEARGYSADGTQTGVSVHICLDCFGAAPEPEPEPDA